MTDSSSSSTTRRTNPVLIILATIGGLSVITILAFLGMGVFLTTSLMRSGTIQVHDDSTDKVGIIEIRGVITSSEQTIKDIRQFRENSAVKAVVVRIDSPGGAVGASQELFQEIKQLDQVKPAIVSMGSLAASGGYYAALGARTIVANPGTITGSIGVIMKIPNLQKLMEKIGIGTTVIKSGKLKDLGSVSRTLTPEEKAVLENVMNDIHEQFISDVASSRHLPVSKVREIADGRIISGRQAKALDIIDELGNFHVAVNIAARAGGISGEPDLLYPERDRLILLRQIFEDGGASTIARGIRQAVKNTDMDMITCR